MNECEQIGGWVREYLENEFTDSFVMYLSNIVFLSLQTDQWFIPELSSSIHNSIVCLSVTLKSQGKGKPKRSKLSERISAPRGWEVFQANSA